MPGRSGTAPCAGSGTQASRGHADTRHDREDEARRIPSGSNTRRSAREAAAWLPPWRVSGIISLAVPICAEGSRVDSSPLMSGNKVFVRETSRPAALLATVIALMLGMCLAPLAERARATEPTPELPNLVADPPTGVFLETSSTEGGLATEGEAKLLLRFNGYVHNKGPGALDFRGRREAPKVSQKTIEEVERAKAKEEGLPQKTEEELAVPPMQVFQRLFTTAVGSKKQTLNGRISKNRAPAK